MLLKSFRLLILFVSLMFSVSVSATELQHDPNRLNKTLELIEAINSGDANGVKIHLQGNLPIEAAALELALAQPVPNPSIVRLLMMQGDSMPVTPAIVDGLLDWSEQLQSSEYLQLAFRRGLNDYPVVDGYMIDAWGWVDPRRHPIATQWLLSDEAPEFAAGNFLGSALARSDIDTIKEYFSADHSFQDLKKLVGLPLTLAASANFCVANYALAMLAYLLEQGADIHSDDGAQALHSAAASGMSEVAHWLLTKGADASFRTSNGNTVLHAMAKRPSHDESLLTALVNKGIGLDLANKEGKTPLKMALEERNTDLASSLIQLGATPPLSMLNMLIRGPRESLSEESLDRYQKLFEVALAQEPDDSVVSLIVKGGSLQALEALTKTCMNSGRKAWRVAMEQKYSDLKKVFTAEITKNTI